MKSIFTLIILLCSFVSFSQENNSEANVYFGGIQEGDMHINKVMAQAGIIAEMTIDSIEIKTRVISYKIKRSNSDIVLQVNSNKFTRDTDREFKKLKIGDTLYIFDIIAKNYKYDSIKANPIKIRVRGNPIESSKMVDIFKSLPIEYTPNLLPSGIDSLLKHLVYEIPSSDSLIIRARRLRLEKTYLCLQYQNLYIPDGFVAIPIYSNGKYTGHHDAFREHYTYKIEIKALNNYNTLIIRHNKLDTTIIKIFDYKNGKLKESKIKIPDYPNFEDLLNEELPDSIKNQYKTMGKIYLNLYKECDDCISFITGIDIHYKDWSNKIFTYKLVNDKFIRLEDE